jgi:hypothetical protein
MAKAKANAKARPMRAHEVRTGDRIVRLGDGREQLVTQTTTRGGTIVLAHGQHAHTETPVDAWVRVIRPTRTAKATAPERPACGIAFHSASAVRQSA